MSYRNTSKQVLGNDPWNSSSPRSLQRPEPQVVDWIKQSPFHVSCVRRCVNKTTHTVLCLNRPCSPPPLQGCTRPKPHVPTPFDPLSSFKRRREVDATGISTSLALVKRGTTASKHAPIAVARQCGARNPVPPPHPPLPKHFPPISAVPSPSLAPPARWPGLRSGAFRATGRPSQAPPRD